MRSVYFGDVSAVARVMLGAPVNTREQLSRQMMEEAEVAGRYARHLRKMHPKWGNGTLRSAALRRRALPEPSFDDPDYCACFRQVLLGLHHPP